MATNLFSRAAAYRKKHPGMSMPEAVKACSKKGAGSRKKKAGTRKKKKAAVGKVRRHKKTAARKAPAKAARKVKIKIKPGKKGSFNLGISGVSHTKMGHELQHVHSLTTAMNRHRELLKQKGLKPAEKAQIRRDIAKYRNNISAAKKHISALKRSI